MRVLIACEFSGVVRDEFTAMGHDAWSCDILPSDRPGNHIKKPLQKVELSGWDLIIAHPPCTHLAASGARWFKNKVMQQKDALEFVQFIFDAPVPMLCLENPIGIISSRIRKPDQIIHPWQFGHGETKATCLWLKNLPKLTPTNIVEGREPRIHKMPESSDRWKKRSITYKGIAEAMATQWNFPILHQTNQPS